MMIIAWKIITRPKTSISWQNNKSRRQILLGKLLQSPKRLLLGNIFQAQDDYYLEKLLQSLRLLMFGK